MPRKSLRKITFLWLSFGIQCVLPLDVSGCLGKTLFSMGSDLELYLGLDFDFGFYDFVITAVHRGIASSKPQKKTKADRKL